MKAQVRPGRFKLAWFLAGIAVTPLSVAIALLPVLAIDSLNLAFPKLPFADTWVAYLAYCALANGCCIGFLQKAIVKRYLRVDLGRWTVYSALGALLAGMVAYPCLGGSCLPPQVAYDHVSPHIYTVLEFASFSLVYLTVFSAAQCIGLRRRVSRSWRWLAAHLGSQLLAMLVSVGILTVPGLNGFDALIGVALSVLFATAASGVLMRRMLSSSGQHDEWAYQPAPRTATVDSRRSVWDEAI